MNKTWTTLVLCAISLAALAAFHSTSHSQTFPADPKPVPSLEYETACKEIIKQRERTLASIVANKARLEALQKMAADLQADLDKEIAADNAIAAYEEAKCLRETRIKLLRQGAMGSPDEIALTVTALGSLRQAIADRQESIRDRNHACLNVELAKSIMEITANLQADQAVLAHLTQRLTQLHQDHK